MKKILLIETKSIQDIIELLFLLGKSLQDEGFEFMDEVEQEVAFLKQQMEKLEK